MNYDALLDVLLLDKVRLLYNRSQTTARMVVQSRDDLDPPLVCCSYSTDRDWANNGYITRT